MVLVRPRAEVLELPLVFGREIKRLPWSPHDICRRAQGGSGVGRGDSEPGS